MQAVIWSDLPRSLLHAQLQDRSGLRVELGDVNVSWRGHTTVRSLSVALPLEQHPFLTTREIRLRHTPLLSVLLTRSLTIRAVEIEAPRLYAIEDETGLWNLDPVAQALRASLSAQATTGPAGPLRLPALALNEGRLTIAPHAQTPTSLPFSFHASTAAPHVWALTAMADTLRAEGRLMTSAPWIHELTLHADRAPALATSLFPNVDFPHTIDLLWKGSIASAGQIAAPALHATLNIRAIETSQDRLEGHASLIGTTERLILTPHRLTLTHLEQGRPPLTISRGSVTLTPALLEADGLIAEHAGHRLTLHRGSVDLTGRLASAELAWNTLDQEGRDRRTPLPPQARHAAADTPHPSSPYSHRGKATLQATFPREDSGTIDATFASDGLALDARWQSRGTLHIEHYVHHNAPHNASESPTATLVLSELHLTPPATSPLAATGLTLDGLTLHARLTSPSTPDAALELVGQDLPGADASDLRATYHLASRQWNASIALTDLDARLIAPDLVTMLPQSADPTDIAARPLTLVASASGNDPLGPKPLSDLSLDLLLATLRIEIASAAPPSSQDPYTATLRLSLAEDPTAPEILTRLTDLTGPLSAAFNLRLADATGPPTLHATGSLTAHAPRIPLSDSSTPHTLAPWTIPVEIELNTDHARLSTPGLGWDDTTIDFQAHHDATSNTQTATLTIDTLDLRTLFDHIASDPSFPLPTPPSGFFHLHLTARTTALNAQAATIEGTLSGRDLSIPLSLPHDQPRDPADLTDTQPLPPHALNASTALATFTLAPDSIVLHELLLTQPDATLRASGTRSTPGTPYAHDLRITADNWPLPLDATLAPLFLTGNAHTASTPDLAISTFDVDLVARSQAHPLARLSLISRGTITTSPDHPTQADAPLPVIQADHINASLLGGTITGIARIPLSDPIDSTFSLTLDSLDLSHPHLAQLIQTLSPSDASSTETPDLHGLLSGPVTLQPSTDPRAHGPRHLTANLTTSGGTVMRLPVDDIAFSLFTAERRLVLDHASFSLAGGTVNLWSRLSHHDDERFMHLSVDAQNLSAGAIAKAFDPEAPDAPGLLSLRAALGGYLAPPHRAYGQADVQITESDLGGLPVITQLYSLLSLDTASSEPTGKGTARFRLEGDTLHLTQFYYFNRGTDLIGNGEIRSIFNWPQSQISGVAAAAARPLRDSALPFAGLLDRVFLAASSRAVSVAISGDPANIKTEVVPLADVQSTLGRLLGEPSIRE